MNEKAAETASTADREIVVSRVLNAPRDLVVKAWTDPDKFVRWWGPNGFTNSIQDMQVRAGGHLQYIMHGPDGTDWPNYIKYREVELPSRLAYEHGAFPGDPGSFQVEVTFDDQGAKTKVTLKLLMASKEVVEQAKAFGAVEGGMQNLERLEKSVTLQLKEFTISRVVDAPLELVWKAYTEAERLKAWWGPKGFTCTIPKMTFIPGGVTHYCLKNDQGFEMWGLLKYRRIVPLESITAIVSFSDEKGGMGRHPGEPDWPQEMLSVTSFEKEGGKTRISVKWSPVNEKDNERVVFENSFPGMEEGFKGTFEQLVEYLAAASAAPAGLMAHDWEFGLKRSFNAPKALVYDVFTKPEHLVYWWGPEGFTLPVCEMEFRNGGSFVWGMRAPDGSDHPMRGTFFDVVPGERFGQITRLDDLSAEPHEIVARFSFTEKDGKTTVEIHQTFAKVDPALKDEAKAGWGQSFQKIDTYLAQKKGK